MSIPKVRLHPHSYKYIGKGHPWVTKDQFSKNFPRESDLLLSEIPKQNQSIILIHDPKHRDVIARVWSIENQREKNNFNRAAFLQQLQDRLDQAIAKRQKLDLKSRDNYYLVFGEADELPGLHALKFGPVILVQYYCFFWHQYSDLICNYFKNHFPESKEIFVQTRGEKKAPKKTQGSRFAEIQIQEFGCHYQLKFNKNYDIGLYTDMANIRQKILKRIPVNSQGLNLFSYTGAYTIAPIVVKNCHVTSVDLSSDYMQWLEENILLNKIENGRFQNHVGDCQHFIRNCTDKSFDWILCDPPTASSNKKSKTNSMQFYRENLSDLLHLLVPGGELYLFLNTHSTSRRQLKNFITPFLQTQHPDVKIVEEYTLGEDCPRKKGFPEGDYLKGLTLKKK